MKIELPLPNEEKQAFVSKKVVHKLPVPFCYAGVQQSNTSKRAAEINFMMDNWARTCR